LLKTKWERSCDEKDARMALSDLHKKFDKVKTIKVEINGKPRDLSLMQLFKEYSKNEEITSS
jgi:hypothetical protein